MTFNIIGKINKNLIEAFAEFCDSVPAGQPVFINVCSQGGHAYCARAIVGLINLLRLKNCLITTRGFGDVHSAAVLIFAAGDRRHLSSSASIMVHSDAGAVEGTTKEIMEYALQMEADDLIWCKIMSGLTGTDVDTWIGLHEDGDKYLTPDECFSLNLATGVI